MKFKVIDKKTGKEVSPRNYYFLLKQNGELWTFNGAGEFAKADEKYEVAEQMIRTEREDFRRELWELKDKIQQWIADIAMTDNGTIFLNTTANHSRANVTYGELRKLIKLVECTN